MEAVMDNARNKSNRCGGSGSTKRAIMPKRATAIAKSLYLAKLGNANSLDSGFAIFHSYQRQNPRMA
jgi:hypothetical protein